MAVFEGKAHGGPRDGIKLTAGSSWEGLIRMPKRYEAQADRYYPGRYIWRESKGWVWIEQESLSQFGHHAATRTGVHGDIFNY